MIETKSKIIKGTEYKFKPLGAQQARTYLLKIINTLGPSLGALTGGIKPVQGKSFMDTDVVNELLPGMSDGFGNAIVKLTTDMTPKFYEDLINVFISQVSACEDNREVQLIKDEREFRFATNLMLELQLLAWCLEAQYHDFFEPVRRLTASAGEWIKTQASVSGSQKAVTGTSGE